MTIVEINSLESNSNKTKRYEGYNHQYHCRRRWHIATACDCDVLHRSIEHTLSVARLLNILLSDSICSILHHHKLK